MLQTRRIPITELNDYLTCKLCKGYFIDATTIIECLHTFCRSCIVKYLENNKYCPVCDVQVHKTKPLLNIRPDKTLQDIVYKLIPRLFQNEMCKRREFYASHPEARPSNLEQCGEVSYQHILSPDETICISLNYHGHGGSPRYLRCPAAVSVVHIQKLLRAKYDLCNNHRIDILHNQDCLNSHLTLLDIAYIYLWRRKGPLELTYRIYENTAKRIKLDVNSIRDGDFSSDEVKSEWKEVQLRISESGEMCVTGVDNSTILNEEITKGNVVEVKNEEDNASAKTDVTQPPPLKPISKANQSAPSPPSALLQTPPQPPNNTSACVAEEKTKKEKNISISTISDNGVATTGNASVGSPSTSGSSSNITTFASFLTTTTTLTASATRSNTSCTYTTLTSVTSCATATSTPPSAPKNDDAIVKKEKSKKLPERKEENDPPTVNTSTEGAVVTPSTEGAVVVSNNEKTKKRKNSADAGEPPIKQPKQTILNHSLGLQGLNKRNVMKNDEKNVTSNVIIRSVTTILPPNSSATATTISSTNNNTAPSKSTAPPPPIIINKSYYLTRPTTPVKKWSTTKTTGPVTVPCYAPKSTTFSSVLNVPRVSTSVAKTDHHPKQQQPPTQTSTKTSLGTAATENKPPSPHCPTSINNNSSSTSSSSSSTSSSSSSSKSSPKGGKSSGNPQGYKTLRDPPKTWNPQISRASLQKTVVEAAAKTGADAKNARPAKFFKMRNNMPRYLGNPASGVKPMYQVQCSGSGEKGDNNKSEIKKHSIVKIDPKTLKPIAEKAPETTSLSNQQQQQQSDLKINTSSVPIFNPLKLQNSPKNDRKSPKSPHSPPKLKTSASSPTSKRDKLNLNFTPPNPFIPNLTSPTLNPNQFLYSAVPPGFPAYDPRVVAAYHNFFYGQGLPFPPPNPVPPPPTPSPTRLGISMNQRKCFEAPGSPKISSPIASSSETLIYTTSSKISSSQKTTTSPRMSDAPKTTSSPTPSTNHLKLHHNVSNTKSSTSSVVNRSNQKSQKDESKESFASEKSSPTSSCQDLSHKNSSVKNSSKKTSNGKEGGNKPEKSIENAVEKLTQSKARESNTSTVKAQKTTEKDLQDEQQKQPEQEPKDDCGSGGKDEEASGKERLVEEKKEMVNGRLVTSNGSLLESKEGSNNGGESTTDPNGNLPTKKLLDNRYCDEKSQENGKGKEEKKSDSRNNDLGNNNEKLLLVQTDSKN